MERRWSWVVAFSCCLINCLLYGVARLSGLWMVSAVEEFQVNRASAALPFSISTSVRNLSGLFAGYLGQRFGLRVVIATGCLLASLGAGLCFFATDITWVIVFWGGIFGLGFGLATCLLPLAINQHFSVHRGTASGISYSGSYIGSFLLSPLAIELLNGYGLSGTFLILSATFLNGFAVSMLFHKPRPFQQPPKEYKDNASREASSQSFLHQFKDTCLRLWKKIKSESCVLKFKNTLPNLSAVYTVDSSTIYDQTYPSVLSEKPYCELTSCAHLSQTRKSSCKSEKILNEVEKMPTHFNRTCLIKKKTKSRLKKIKKSFKKRDKKRYSFNTKILIDNIECVSYKSLTSTIEIHSFCSTLYNSNILCNDPFSRFNQKVNAQDCILLKAECLHENGLQNSELELKYGGTHSYQTAGNETKNISVSFEKNPMSRITKGAFVCLFGWTRLYTEPMFVVIAVTMSLHTFVIVCMITIIEDFAKDIRIPECQVHYVLMALSMADLIGSLTLGAITDRGVLSRLNFLILCFFGMAVCQLSISLVRSFAVLLTLVVIYGLLESGIIITFPLLIAHFIPQKKQPTAVASSNLLSSPSVLLVPLVIGYFRDRAGGCYRGVFYCLGVTSLCCSFIWLLVPKIFVKKKEPS